MQGSLDTQIAPDDADRLETLAQRRKLPAAATRKAVIPGVNHLLVPARTGEQDEYATLDVNTISQNVKQTILDWLNDVLKNGRVDSRK